MKSIFWAVLTILCLMAAPLQASEGAGGTESPFAFGVDARALGLGGAYAGLGEGAGAIYWNPGGLGFVRRKELSSLYVPLYEQVDYAFLSMAYPILGFGTVGVGVLGMSTQGISKTDESDRELGLISDLQMQSLLSFSRIWLDGLSVGANLKLYYHQLGEFNGSGIGADVGVLYDAGTYVPGLTLGLMARNIVQPQITMVSAPDVYPLHVRLGGAWRTMLDKGKQHRMVVSADLSKSEYEEFVFHAGAEYQAWRLISLRFGWDGDHLNAGLGVDVLDWRLDYTLVFPNEFDPIHMVSLGWQFGASMAEEESRKREALVKHFSEEQALKQNKKGLALLKKGKAEEAVEAFENALRWVEHAPEIAANLKKARTAYHREKAQTAWEEGQTAYKKKKYVEAYMAWKEVQQWDPQFPKIARWLDQAAKHIESDKAVQTGRQAGNRQSRNRRLFQQGITRYMNNDWQAAIGLWQKVLKDNPDYPGLQAYVSKAKRQLAGPSPGRRGDAVSAENKKKADECYKKGLIDYRQKKYRAAREQWQSALRLDPKHTEAKRGLERVRAILQVLEQQ